MNEKEKAAAKLIFLKLGVKISSAKSSFLENNNDTTENNHNPETGYYYNYNYRSGNNSKIDGSICTNNQPYEGIIFGKIKCPVNGFEENAVLCCDEPGQQYCCAPLNGLSNLSIILIVLGIVLSILVACLASYSCKKCKESYDKKYSQAPQDPHLENLEL